MFSIPAISIFGVEYDDRKRKHLDMWTERYLKKGQYDEEDESLGDMVEFPFKVIKSEEWGDSQASMLNWVVENWIDLVPKIRDKVFSEYVEIWDQLDCELEGDPLINELL